MCTLGDLSLDVVVKVIGIASPKDVWQQGACKHKEGRQAIGAAKIPGPLTQHEQARNSQGLQSKRCCALPASKHVSLTMVCLLLLLL